MTNKEYEVIIYYQDPWDASQGSTIKCYFTKERLLQRITQVKALEDDGIAGIVINGKEFTGKAKNWYWLDEEDTQKVIDYVQSL